jgi:maltose alpha-D-glucosyltransferase/alpha-amylase
MLTADNPRVLAFVRSFGDESVLVVANLSRSVQYVRLDLSKYKGLAPIELFGRTRFPAIDDAPYMLTLGGHAFYWFSIERPREASLAARAESYAPPMVDIADWESTLAGDGRALLADVLPGWLVTRPWFDLADRSITKVSIVEVIPVARDAGGALELAIAEIEFAVGPPERCLLPIGLVPGERAGEVLARAPQATIAHVRVLLDTEPLAETGARRSLSDVGALVYDALLDPPSCLPLLDAVVRRRRWRANTGEVAGSTLRAVSSAGRGAALRVLRPESPRPVIVFADELVLKLFRRLDDGQSPDLEIGRFLAGRGTQQPAAELIGALEQRPATGRGDAVTLAIMEQYVQNEGDAWSHARGELGRYYERVLVGAAAEPPAVPLRVNPIELALTEPPRPVREASGNYLDWAHLLGRRTAEMHASLVADDDPAFAAEAYAALDQRSVYQSMRNLTGKVLGALRTALPHLPADAAAEAAALIEAEAALLDRFERLLERKLSALRTRCHGNLHLQQALFTGKDFVIIDFEGDRSRPLSERRRKRSPLQDVASMLRSYHYAAMTALLNPGVVREADRAAAMQWAEAWHLWTGAAFVSGWLAGAGDAAFVPKDNAEIAVLLDAFVLERALIELNSELHSRLDRAVIPLRRLTQLIQPDPAASTP